MTRKEQKLRKAKIIREIRSGKSPEQAAVDYGMSYSSISKMMRGKR